MEVTKGGEGAGEPGFDACIRADSNVELETDLDIVDASSCLTSAGINTGSKFPAVSVLLI